MAVTPLRGCLWCDACMLAAPGLLTCWSCMIYDIVGRSVSAGVCPELQGPGNSGQPLQPTQIPNSFPNRAVHSSPTACPLRIARLDPLAPGATVFAPGQNHQMQISISLGQQLQESQFGLNGLLNLVTVTGATTPLPGSPPVRWA